MIQYCILRFYVAMWKLFYMWVKQQLFVCAQSAFVAFNYVIFILRELETVLITQVIDFKEHLFCQFLSIFEHEVVKELCNCQPAGFIWVFLQPLLDNIWQPPHTPVGTLLLARLNCPSAQVWS